MTRAGRLAGKSALITGGGAGIGAATAALFCAEEANVVLVDASAEALQHSAAAIEAEHPGATVVPFVADVADEAGAFAAVQCALDTLGGLDVLVNNAAMRHHGPLAEAAVDDWLALVGVNLLGTAHYCKAALPALRRSASASIINVSSCYAVTGRKGMGLYDATKAAMLALTRTLAFEEAAHGVRANAICPGSTLTDFHVGRAQAAGRSIEQLKTERNNTSLVGRWATPQEIAWPIVWLASDEATYITGTTLMVDGGLHIM